MAEKKSLVRLETLSGVACRHLWDMLTSILVQGNMQIEKEKIKIFGLADELHVRVELKNFDLYQVDEKWWSLMKENSVIGVDFGTLHKVFQSVKDGDKVVLLVNEDEFLKKDGERQSMQCQIISPLSVTQDEINVLDLKLENVELVDPSFPSEIYVQTALFMKAIRNHQKVGEYTQLVTMLHPDNNMPILVLVTQGQERKTRTIIGTSEPGKGIESVLTAAVEKKDVFSLKALSLVMKGSNLSKFMKLMIKDASPLVIAFPVGTLGEVQFQVRAHEERSGEGLDIISQAVKGLPILPKSLPSIPEEKPPTTARTKRSKRKPEVIAGKNAPKKGCVRK